jgi:hypothetical protein
VLTVSQYRSNRPLRSIDELLWKIEATAPTSAKLFINLPNPGFGDVEDVAPVQKVELSSEDLARATPVNLKTVKFQRVNRYKPFSICALYI